MTRLAHQLLIWFILLLFGTIACQTKIETPFLPDVGVSVHEMNKRILARAPLEINSFRTDDIVYLEIKLVANQTQEQIAFNLDLGARLFIKEGEQWLEIKNIVKYPQGEGEIVLSSSDSWGRQALQFYKPELPNLTKSTVVRFVLIGNIIKNGQVTDDKTGAYIDVELIP